MSSKNNNLNDDHRSRLSSSTWRPSPGPFDTQMTETPNSLAAASRVKPNRAAEYKHYQPTSMENSPLGHTTSTPISARNIPNSLTASDASGRGRDRFRELKSYKERYQDVKEMSMSPSGRSSHSKATRSCSAERYSARDRSRGPRSRSSDRYTARQRHAREVSPDEKYPSSHGPRRSGANTDIEYERARRRTRSRSSDKYTARQRSRDASSPSRYSSNRSPDRRVSNTHNINTDRWESRKEQKARRNIDPDGKRMSQTLTSRSERWSPKESNNNYDGDAFETSYRHSHQRRSSGGGGSPLFDDVDEEGAGNIHVGESSPLSIGNLFDESESDDTPPRTPGKSPPRAGVPRTPGSSSSSGTPGQSPRRSPGHSVSSKSSSKTKSTYADDLASFTNGITTAVIHNHGSTYDAESQSYDPEKRVRWGANALCGRFTRPRPRPAATKKWQTKYVLSFALIFAVLCIAAAVGTVLHLNNLKKQNLTETAVMPTPTPPTSVAHPTGISGIGTDTRLPTSTFASESSNQPTGQREKLIGQFLEALSDGKSSSVGTPQFKARNWLLFDDDLNLHLPYSGENWEDSEVAGRIQQRFALATMYYSMGVGEGGVVKGWLEGDVCRFVGDYGRAWDGVDCNEDGKVRAIALDAANLQGTIPQEISLLTDVENLIIKNNQNLVGEIPHKIGKLSQLRQLGLYDNNLGGSIPNSVFKLAHLVYLNLADNKLIGEVNWEEMAHHQKKIERLILHNNFLEGSIDFHILAKTSLLLLVLSNNKFGGYIDEAVGSMPSLEYLYLDKNELIGSIPDGIGNLANIKSINLDENELYGTLPHTLGNLANLEHFSAKKNTISGSFPPSMKLLHNLKTLNLARNAMSGHLRNLPHMWGLKNLHLYQNGFVGTIPETLFDLPNLEVLFLSSNLLTGEIPSAVTGAQQTLKSLYLSDNKLHGHIPTDLCGLYKLEDLFIDANDFDGPLPKCLGSLSNLKKLYAFKNRLTGDVPNGLLNLPNLIEVGIEENYLTGGVSHACTRERGMSIWADCNELEGGCECCEKCCSDLDSSC